MIRRILLFFLILLAVAVALVYLFIPPTVPVSCSGTFVANSHAVSRSLKDYNDWRRWWPGYRNDSVEHRYFLFKASFTPNAAEDSAVYVRIASPYIGWATSTDNLQTRLGITGSEDGNTTLHWTADVRAAQMDPYHRLMAYLTARQVGQLMDDILFRLKFFMKDETNLYGVTVAAAPAADSALVFATLHTSAPPATALIYHDLEELQSYLEAHHCPAGKYPVIETEKTAEGGYETRAGYVVGKSVTASGRYGVRPSFPQRVLTTEVTGGDSTVSGGTDVLQRYVNDHQWGNRGQPYQVMLTDRNSQPDTSRWITRICVPIK